MAIGVVDQLIEHGEVTRGFLGIEIRDLPRTLAQTYGYDGEGVLIVNPLPGGPADEAGLRSEDIITAINGDAIRDADELRYQVGAMRPGEPVQVTIFRNGETLTKTVTLTEMPRDATARIMPGRGGDSGQDTGAVESSGMALLQKLGIERVSRFTEAEAQRLGVVHQEGVLVEEVRPRSIAAVNRVSAGTIITRVMRTDVSTVEELSKAVAEVGEDQPIRFRVLHYSRQMRQFVPDIIAMQLD
jgi:serine protease Do